MSVNGIQGFGSIQGMEMGGMRQAVSLTDDQKKQIQTILSKYDSENLTAEDAKSIFQEFKEAGIQPARGMKEAIEAAGFDAEKLREMGMPKGDRQGPPPPPPGGKVGGQNSINTSALKSLQSILNQYDLSNLSSDQESDLYSQLNDSGLLETGNILNLSA